MNSGFRRVAVMIGGLLILCAPVLEAAAEEPIRVPFSFRWGDPSAVVEETVVRAQARVAERKDENGRIIYVVQGHPDPRLKQSLFYFQNDALIEIELQYADAAWDAGKFDQIFDETRRALDRKYGQGRNIARQRMEEDGVMESVVGYQWTQQDTTLRLFSFTAERGSETFRMLSYHYRGY